MVQQLLFGNVTAFPNQNRHLINLSFVFCSNAIIYFWVNSTLFVTTFWRSLFVNEWHWIFLIHVLFWSVLAPNQYSSYMPSQSLGQASSWLGGRTLIGKILWPHFKPVCCAVLLKTKVKSLPAAPWAHFSKFPCLFVIVPSHSKSALTTQVANHSKEWTATTT